MSGGDDDALRYDAYVEACLRGEIEPPEEFFARHPGLGGEARASIVTVFRNVSAGEGAPALPARLAQVAPISRSRNALSDGWI